MRSPTPARPWKREGVGPERHAEPGHLGQPAGDQRRLGVLPEPHPDGHPVGQGDDVLDRAADLRTRPRRWSSRGGSTRWCRRPAAGGRCARRRRQPSSRPAGAGRSPGPGWVPRPRRRGRPGPRRPRRSPGTSAAWCPARCPSSARRARWSPSTGHATGRGSPAAPATGSPSTTRSAPARRPRGVGARAHAGRQVDAGVVALVAVLRPDLLGHRRLPGPQDHLAPGVGQDHPKAVPHDPPPITAIRVTDSSCPLGRSRPSAFPVRSRPGSLPTVR